MSAAAGGTSNTSTRQLRMNEVKEVPVVIYKTVPLPCASGTVACHPIGITFVLFGLVVPPMVPLVCVLDMDFHPTASKEVSIRETSDGWKAVPLLVFIPLAFSTSQMPRREAPCFLRGTITPDT